MKIHIIDLKGVSPVDESFPIEEFISDVKERLLNLNEHNPHNPYDQCPICPRSMTLLYILKRYKGYMTTNENHQEVSRIYRGMQEIAREMLCDIDKPYVKYNCTCGFYFNTYGFTNGITGKEYISKYLEEWNKDKHTRDEGCKEIEMYVM